MAPATASGGPVSIVRVSGKDLSFLASIIGPLPAPGSFSLRAVLSERTEVIDHSLVLFFKAPHSFTGEDVIEIQAHGVASVIKAICELVKDSGARTALPGEFSFRAVMNGKMTLEQAEALQSALGTEGLNVKYAAQLLSSQSSDSVTQRLNDAILKIEIARGRVEAGIDFPESETEQSANLNGALSVIDDLQKSLSRLLSSFENFCLSQSEPRIALVGPTNVGKSTLFNLLCGGQRALVSKIPGTTRDVVEAKVRLPSGRWVRLLDTAGLRVFAGSALSDHESLESQGMALGVQASQQAQLIVRVEKASYRGHRELSERTLDIYSHADESPLYYIEEAFDFVGDADRACLWLLKKIDERLDILESAVTQDVLGETALISGRQETLLRAVVEDIGSAREAVLGNRPLELAAIHLSEAEATLKKCVGREVGNEYIGQIFSQFCLGK